MADWKDDKDLGPWAFNAQENKWGYLNNKRWNYYGYDALDESQHNPCGHWHKTGGYAGSGITTKYENFGPEWWYQPSVDILGEDIAIVSMHFDGDIDDKLSAILYDADEGEWKSYGATTDQAMPIYGQPNCARLSSNGSLFFYTCCIVWGEAWQLHHHRLYRFQYGLTPLYYDVFLSHWTTLTPYKCVQEDMYNYMDCAGDRVACLAWLTGKAGAPVYYKAIKVSDDNGATFHTEFALNNATSNLDHSHVRMSSDGIVWIAYVRPLTNMVELWKSNAAATNFTKIWEVNFAAALGVVASFLLFGVSDTDGQDITISLGGYSAPSYYRSTYYSTNYGVAFNVNNYNTATYTMATVGSIYGQGVVFSSREIGTANYGYMKSTDNGATFNFLNPVIPGMDLTYSDFRGSGANLAYVECAESFNPASTNQGILFSDDFGETWSIIEAPLSNVGGMDQIVISGSSGTSLTEPQVWNLP